MSKNALAVSLAVAGSLVLTVPAVWAHGANKHKSPSTAEIDTEQHPWGVAAAPDKADRTIQVVMLDSMRFEPDSLSVSKDETVRFVIANKGKIMHEFVLGTDKVLDEHAAMMVKFPNMEHDAPYMAHVAPGETGEITWKFNRDGVYKFGCLIPGHFQAGMIGAVKVAALDNGSSAGHAHGKTKAANEPVKLAQSDMAQGEIKRMKKGSKKLTIKHGDIPSLQMPPMTMVFEAKDEAMLEGLKKGDKIKFNVVEQDGKMVITEIEAADKK